MTWDLARKGQRDEPRPKQPPVGRSGDNPFQKPTVLELVNNRIYFYSEVDRQSILTLNKSLTEIAANHVTSKITYSYEHIIPIYLHINSFGGSMFDGLAGMDQIIRTSATVPVVTVVDGCCASAGTFLSMVGVKRLMNKHAYMLIHQLQSAAWGKFEEIKDEMGNLEKFMKTIVETYKQYTKIPEPKLREILKHDLWFDSKECLKYGMIDQII